MTNYFYRDAHSKGTMFAGLGLPLPGTAAALLEDHEYVVSRGLGNGIVKMVEWMADKAARLLKNKNLERIGQETILCGCCNETASLRCYRV